MTLAEAAERIGAVDVSPLPSGTKKADRYLHAKVRLPPRHGQFRLKVVNPERHDAASISECCRVANLVHGGLIGLKRDLGFRLPQCLVHDGLERSVYVVEEIERTTPSLDPRDGLAAVVDRMVAMELATCGFDPPPSKPPWIESCNRKGYRDRLRSSLQGLRERAEIASHELDEVVARFNEYWAAGPLDAGRCLSHGDFSLGNMRAGGGELWLIDFEHSHIGAPVLDMTHLCVNLMFDGHIDTALQLRQQYDALRVARGLPPLPGVFSALFLERAAGKWNAMKSPSAERRARIRTLLLHQHE